MADIKDIKISGLTAAASAALEQLIMITDDPSGTPSSKKLTLSQLNDLIGGSGLTATTAPMTDDGTTVSLLFNTDFVTSGTTLALSATGITAGTFGGTAGSSYVIRGVTTDAKGRISAIVVGTESGGGGGVSAAEDPLQITGTTMALLFNSDFVTSGATMALSPTGITAGTFGGTAGSSSVIRGVTTDAKGRVSAIIAGTESGGGGGATVGKNVIIGGDFTTNPWQRGSSFTSVSASDYTADRFQWTQVGAGVVNIDKTADAPTAAESSIHATHCLDVSVATADSSIAAGDAYAIFQPVEGLNAARFGFGKAGTRYITISFWHNHTKTGTHCVAIANGSGNRSYVSEYTQTTTNTWEKAEIAIPVDTSGTWNYDTSTGLQLRFALDAGSNFQTTADTWAAGSYWATANQANNLDSTANHFKIALIQLEAGQTATDFDARDVGTETLLCNRYYFQHDVNAATLDYAGLGVTHTTTLTHIVYNTGSVMRAYPTLSLYPAYDTGSGWMTNDGVTNAALSATPTIIGVCGTAAALQAQSATVREGYAARLYNNTGSNGHIAFSAEL